MRLRRHHNHRHDIPVTPTSTPAPSVCHRNHTPDNAACARLGDGLPPPERKELVRGAARGDDNDDIIMLPLIASLRTARLAQSCTCMLAMMSTMITKHRSPSSRARVPDAPRRCTRRAHPGLAGTARARPGPPPSHPCAQLPLWSTPRPGYRMAAITPPPPASLSGSPRAVVRAHAPFLSALGPLHREHAPAVALAQEPVTPRPRMLGESEPRCGEKGGGAETPTADRVREVRC